MLESGNEPNNRLLLGIVFGAPLVLITMIAFIPRLARGARWRGTNVPISRFSRVIGLLLGWMSALTLLEILPKSVWMLIIAGGISSVALYWRDKRIARGEGKAGRASGVPGAGDR